MKILVVCLRMQDISILALKAIDRELPLGIVRCHQAAMALYIYLEHRSMIPGRGDGNIQLPFRPNFPDHRQYPQERNGNSNGHGRSHVEESDREAENRPKSESPELVYRRDVRHRALMQHSGQVRRQYRNPPYDERYDPFSPGQSNPYIKLPGKA